MPLLFAGLYALRCSFRIGKLSVFISVHRFEEIFSALIDSAVDMPDKLRSEDYSFSLCVRLLSRGTGRYRYSEMGANADRAIVLLCMHEQSALALQV